MNVPLSVVQNFKIRPFNMPKIIISSKRGGGGGGVNRPTKTHPPPLGERAWASCGFWPEEILEKVRMTSRFVRSHGKVFSEPQTFALFK